MKTCAECGRLLLSDAFFKHPNMADGRLGKCKECVKAYKARHYTVRGDHYRAYDMGRKTPRRALRNNEATRAWREANPRKTAAHMALNNAIRRGLVTRKPCMSCGGKADAHHEDYSRPLDVLWLCPLHHKRRHKELLALGIVL